MRYLPLDRGHTLAISGALALWSGLMTIATCYPVTAARFPAFAMTYEVTTWTADAKRTDVYHHIYENDRMWKQAWVRSTEYNHPGTAQTTTSTKLVYGSSAVPGYHIPGPWLASEQSYLGRGHRLPFAVVTQQRVPAAEADHGRAVRVVTITSHDEQTEIRFDAGTGIPVRYEERVWSAVVRRHVVTSLMLATGQTIR